MEVPEKPEQNDCCNSGCTPCVFDVYDEQVKRYEECIKRKTDSQHNTIVRNIISSVKYTPFTVVRIEEINECHKLFTFQYQSDEQSNMDGLLRYSAGQHFILRSILYEQSKSPYFSRPYTPIKSYDFIEIDKTIINTRKLNKETCFQIIVRLYDNGAMSKYLANIKLGDISYWRGPYGSFEYVPNKYKNVLMISQGTGIVPLYSILLQLLKNDEDLSVVMLYSCFKNIKNILLREELYELESYWNFNYNLFLSESLVSNSENFKHKYKEPIIYQRFSRDFIEPNLSKITQNVLVLICGCDNFLTHYKNIAIDCGVSDDCIVTF